MFNFFQGTAYRISNNVELTTAVICGIMIGIGIGFMLKVFLDTIELFKYMPYAGVAQW